MPDGQHDRQESRAVTNAPRPGGPLRGIHVLDMSRLVAGNMLSLQLADFGADVIKVESLRGGDTLRHWRDSLDDGETLDAWWQVYGRNKRSLAVDFRKPESLPLIKRLAGKADVLIESFRPGTLETMGLAPEELHAVNPRLVIVRLSGWGQSGPYRDLPGFGSLIEGFSGFAHKHTQGGTPVLPNMALADMVAGLTGAFATLAAVREVESGDGKGQVIDLSLLEPMLAIMGPDATLHAATGRLPDPTAKIASPRGVFRCRDGRWVALSGSTDSMARKVFEVIGHPELLDDPEYATNSGRLDRDDELTRLIADVICEMDLDVCLERFRSHGVTIGPVYDPAQLLRDSHVRERGCYVSPERSQGPLMHAVTPRLDRTPGEICRTAPAIGEQTASILQELGFTQKQIVELQSEGVIRCG